MDAQILAREQRLPGPPAAVFEFFADAHNLWQHAHSFEADGDATIMRDVVRYRIGFGPLGFPLAPRRSS